MLTHVVKVDDGLVFDDGTQLFSSHENDCCEHHYLCFEHIKLEDFAGLAFDLTGDQFFERVKDYGIRLLPVNGAAISIPGYGYNNGYYSSELTLVLHRDRNTTTFDITDCQVIDG